MRHQRDALLFTSSAPTTTLFSSHIDHNRQPASLLASAAVHVLFAAIVGYGVVTAPSVVHISNDRVTVRRLDLSIPEKQAASNGKSKAAHEVAKSLTAAIGHTPAALQLQGAYGAVKRLKRLTRVRSMPSRTI